MGEQVVAHLSITELTDDAVREGVVDVDEREDRHREEA